MNKKLLRRIIAWVGIVAAVAFAVLFVLNFYKFGERADALIDAFLWAALALTVISFGVAKYVIREESSYLPLDDAREAEGGEGDVESGDDNVPDSEGNEDGKDEDNGSGD